MHSIGAAQATVFQTSTSCVQELKCCDQCVDKLYIEHDHILV